MDIIFKIAIFSLPFENLFFAPSAGWATITPIILFIYCILNFKLLLKSIERYGKIFAIIVFILLPISIINYLLEKDTAITNVVNSLFSLVLGLTNLLAFDIYFNQKKNKIDKITKIILIAYSISICVGMIQFLTIKLNINALKNLFKIVSKRNYINAGRVQFTFTEPSYIGMHIFGVLLPFYIASKNKKILKLICVYLIFALTMSASVKLFLDVFMITLIWILVSNIKNKKIVISILIAIPIGIGILSFLYQNNNRVKMICDKGIYADGSLASRFFRINASIKGYKDNPLHFFIGYGLGNSMIPMKIGYKEAYAEYDNNWTDEIDRIGRADYTNDSDTLCFYIKMTSEFGIISLIALFLYIYNLRNKVKDKWLRIYFWVLIYLYIQFESYAFYTIWLYIVLLKQYLITEGKKENEK